jgi:hypothetical protein
MAARLTKAYGNSQEDAAARIAYYDALRCALEIAVVAEYRSGTQELERPPWDRGARELARRFASISGVTVEMPPSKQRPDRR